jgi:hypothetical protein
MLVKLKGSVINLDSVATIEEAPYGIRIKFVTEAVLDSACSFDTFCAQLAVSGLLVSVAF